MRLGIDARFLTHPQMGGFKTYTENLLRSILEIDRTNFYYIYIDRPQVNGALPEMQNCVYKVVDGTLPFLGVPVREQVYLRRQIAQDRIDLMHFLCNTGTVGLSCKYVLTLHDTIQVKAHINDLFSISNFKNQSITAYSKWAVNKTVYHAKRVIAVSEYEKWQMVHDLGLSPSRVTVIHAAPNSGYLPMNKAEKDEWRAELAKRYQIQKKYILGVGYEPRKNIPLLMKAFSILATKLAGYDLVIIASNSEQLQSFQNLALELKIGDRVVVIGKIPSRDMIPLYNLAEIFVFPSEAEGFGLPPLEAMACGTPTIAMNMTSLPEVLGNGAVLVDGKEPNIWEEAIRQILTSPQLHREWSDRALKRASEFSWRRCAQETIDLYQQVGDF